MTQKILRHLEAKAGSPPNPLPEGPSATRGKPVGGLFEFYDAIALHPGLQIADLRRTAPQLSLTHTKTSQPKADVFPVLVRNNLDCASTSTRVYRTLAPDSLDQRSRLGTVKQTNRQTRISSYCLIDEIKQYGASRYETINGNKTVIQFPEAWHTYCYRTTVLRKTARVAISDLQSASRLLVLQTDIGENLWQFWMKSIFTITG